jgi:hypothetical protein
MDVAVGAAPAAQYTGRMDQIFSKTIRAATVKDQPQTHSVVADPAQCAALAADFGIPAIKSLAGDFLLLHERGGIIRADLRLRAVVTQLCVITLEPFDAAINEQAQLRFVPARLVSETADLAEVDAETLEGPDEIPYTGDTIDLGAALAEQLALSLDPYPRKPGATLPEGLSEPEDHPFAALAARKQGSDEPA